MTVEAAEKRGTPATLPPERGVVPISEKLAQELATIYVAHVSQNSDNHGSNPYLLGQMEVEGQVLRMLGQEHLLVVGRNQPLPIPRLTRLLQPITPRYLEDLVGSYRVAQEFCQGVELREKGKKLKETTPAERRVEGRRDTLVHLLTILRKSELVSSIDSQTPMRPEMVDYQRQRCESTGQTH